MSESRNRSAREVNAGVQLTLTGKISAGDAKRVARLLGEDDSTVVFFDSTGGDCREGSALAALIKERIVRTFVSPGSSCLSACAIAFLAGTAEGEEGSQRSARSIAVDEHLGFHAPFIETGGSELTLRAVEDAFDRAIGTVTELMRIAGGYGVSVEVAADMMTPQRSEQFSADASCVLCFANAVLQFCCNFDPFPSRRPST